MKPSDLSGTLKRTLAKINSFWADFSKKELRDEFVSAHLGSRLASQVYALRKQRGWTQAKLAGAIGTGQSRISLLEESCEDVSLNTLKKLASAFDVALLVRFVPFSSLLQSAVAPSDDETDIPSFAEDRPPALGDGPTRLLQSRVDPPGGLGIWATHRDDQGSRRSES